jgi:predicted RNase H-like nuclease (RuvC/YqgF family)
MMPYDSEASRLQGEIAQLEKEIETLQWLCGQGDDEYNELGDAKRLESVKCTLTRLSRELEYKEMKLSIHRQRTKESGVKY